MQNLNDPRRKVNVVLIKDENGARILFENHPLSGELGLTWFPIPSALNCLVEIEKIMVLASVAHNVVSTKVLSYCWDESKEHGRKIIEVTYNTPVEKEYVITVRNSDIDNLIEDFSLASFRIKSGNIVETLLKLDYTEHLSKHTSNLIQYYKKVSYSAFDSEIYIGDGEKQYMVVQWTK